jgi:HK97 family phage portal protein
MKLQHIKGSKAVISIPGWAEKMMSGNTSGEVNSAADAYNRVPLLYRAVKLRADSLASVPVTVTAVGSDKEVEWPFEGVKLNKFLWLNEASMMIYGASYWWKGKGERTGFLKELQYINPTRVTTQPVGSIRQGAYDFTFQVDGENVPKEDLVWYWEYNPNDEVNPGKGAGQVALDDSRLLRYLTLFSSKFFAGGAMPITLLSVDGTIDENERQRVQGFFRQRVTGWWNAFRVLALSKAITPTVLTQKIKDMDMSGLEESAKWAVNEAFGIPQTMTADAANYATAKEHRQSFWTDTIRPRGSIYEDVTNNQLLNEHTPPLVMTMGWEQMDVFQEDENERSDAVKKYVEAGYPLSVASEILGVELPDGMEYEDLDEPEEDESEENQDENQNETQQSQVDKEDEDLKKWERKALKRLGKELAPACTFESEFISPGKNGAITAMLENAETKEDVKTIFADQWAGYP